MYKYVIKRILLVIPILLGVAIVVFTLLHFANGDPAAIILGEGATAEAKAALRAEMGLDQPYLVQLFRYIAGLLHGDMGNSYYNNKTVLECILAVLPTTLKLSTIATIVATIVGVSLGIISAVKQYSATDYVCVGVALVGTSVPLFWWGMMLILLFSVKLRWFPASGSYGPKYFVLPVITLATAIIASLLRMTRSSMLDVVRQDYIKTARSKGQREFLIVMKHAFRNALVPIITVVGMYYGSALAGSVITENVFSISGMGKLMLDSIAKRDYPVVIGCILWIALIYAVINLIVDIAYGFVDPRIKATYQTVSKKKLQSEVNSTDG